MIFLTGSPKAKCNNRQIRCTFVKFHRQTAPAGPGHHQLTPPPTSLPALSSSTTSNYSHSSASSDTVPVPPLTVPSMADNLFGDYPNLHAFPPHPHSQRPSSWTPDPPDYANRYPPPALNDNSNSMLNPFTDLRGREWTPVPNSNSPSSATSPPSSWETHPRDLSLPLPAPIAGERYMYGLGGLGGAGGRGGDVDGLLGMSEKQSREFVGLELVHGGEGYVRVGGGAGY
ncbi:hypothetical protein H0H87_010122 [Tephrocybe sp. NHM501043]|nr:hypothetical protein H0H87_010122 [Tephrocybe sp. NHM501043]